MSCIYLNTCIYPIYIYVFVYFLLQNRTMSKLQLASATVVKCCIVQINKKKYLCNRKQYATDIELTFL